MPKPVSTSEAGQRLVESSTRRSTGPEYGAVGGTVAAIRQQVADGRLVPGQRLVEPELVAELGVSRASLREALRALEAEGLVTIEPYKGASVRRLDRDQILESFEIRELLEGLAARRSANAFAEQGPWRQKLLQVRHAMEEAAEAHLMTRYAQLNRDFHRLVLEAAQSRQLQALEPHLNPPVLLRTVQQRLMETAAIERSMKEHLLIIEALLTGDSAGAEKAMRAHLRSSRQQFEKAPVE